MTYTIEEYVICREMDDLALASQASYTARLERVLFTVLASRVTLPPYKRAEALRRIDQQERRRLAVIRNESQGWAPPQTEDLFRKYHQRRKGRSHGR